MDMPKKTPERKSTSDKILEALESKHVTKAILSKGFGANYLDKLKDKFSKYVNTEGNTKTSKGKPKLADQIILSFAVEIRNELADKGLAEKPSRGKSAKPVNERLLSNW